LALPGQKRINTAMKQAIYLLLSGLLALGTPALASSDLELLAEIDILDGGKTARGTYMGALRVNLQPGWKTYWRSPGDAGIPPTFDWQGSRNIEAVSITWPTPEVVMTAGYRTIGYYDQLVLPVEITPKKPGRPMNLTGRMQLGICKDVCVPAVLSFEHQLDLQASRNPAIIAALANRPYSAKEAGVKSAKCSVSPTKYGMQVEARIAMPPAGGEEVAIIESGTTLAYGLATATRRQGGTLIATTEFLPSGTDGFSLQRSQLRITVLGKKHAVDIQGCTAG
jgi:DsbC/DsbD-like thiol-disulfide interchange protein